MTNIRTQINKYNEKLKWPRPMTSSASFRKPICSARMEIKFCTDYVSLLHNFVKISNLTMP